MSEIVRCGVLGLGMIGSVHAQLLSDIPGAELVCCCDTDASAAERVPKRASFTTDAAELLDLARIDAVWICTPETLHRSHVEQALDAGLAVFCEKPLARTLEDADAIVERVAGSGVVFAVGHLLRFDPRYVAVRDAVAAGHVGRIATIAARRNVPDFEGRLLAARTSPALEIGVHDIDVMQWLAGKIDRVYGEPARSEILGPGTVDAIVATLRFRDGAVGTLEVGWVTPADTGLRSDYRLSLVGSEGGAFVELRDDGVAVFSRAGTTFPRASVALRMQDEQFVCLVREGGSWPLAVADARSALAVAVAIDASIARGCPAMVDFTA